MPNLTKHRKKIPARSKSRSICAVAARDCERLSIFRYRMKHTPSRGARKLKIKLGVKVLAFGSICGSALSASHI